MDKNINLVENKEARKELIGHLEVLDKVKAIAFLTKDLVITTEQAANYYEVDVETIKKVITRNKEELISNGLKIIKGQELKDFKISLGNGQNVPNLKFASALTLLTKRAILNVGMLLTESEVAEKVRQYLLNLEDQTTDEQKENAINETVEQIESKLGIKLLRKQHREDSKLITIQSSINKLTLYGLSKAEASYIIQKAITDKVNIEKATLEKIEELKNLETDIQRGIVREKAFSIAKNYYDNDYELVFHLMSEKMRYLIGFNMRAYRDRLKAKNEKAERGCKVKIPSYLDIIVQYNSYESAKQALQELVIEKEEIKANSRRKPCEAVQEVTPKEVENTK